jgi:hypothetical protein
MAKARKARPKKPRWSRSGDPINKEACLRDINRYIEYVFPRGTFGEALTGHGYTDVEVSSDQEKAHCYDVKMQGPDGVTRAQVRQHLEDAAAQIPESPITHLQWRVELSAVICVDRQIAAQVRVAHVEMQH